MNERVKQMTVDERLAEFVKKVEKLQKDYELEISFDIYTEAIIARDFKTWKDKVINNGTEKYNKG